MRRALRYGFGMEQPKSADDDRAEYRGNFAGFYVPRSKFDAALMEVVGVSTRLDRDARRAAMIAAFNGEATWDAIRSWRRGVRNPPKWARDLIFKKAKEKAAALLHVAALLEDEKR